MQDASCQNDPEKLKRMCPVTCGVQNADATSRDCDDLRSACLSDGEALTDREQELIGSITGCIAIDAFCPLTGRTCTSSINCSHYTRTVTGRTGPYFAMRDSNPVQNWSIDQMRPTRSSCARSAPMSDNGDGSYTATVPPDWITSQGEHSFRFFRGEEEFRVTSSSMGRGTNPHGVTYDGLRTVDFHPIECNPSANTEADITGGSCVCKDGFEPTIQNPGVPLSCHRQCLHGAENTADGNDCVCGKGSYMNLRGQCETCPAWAVCSGGHNATLAFCPSGEQATAQVCEACPEGKAGGNTEECMPCPPDTLPNSRRAACDCAPGFYNASAGWFECVDDDSGFDSATRDSWIGSKEQQDHPCRPCPPCAECSGRGRRPVLKAGYLKLAALGLPSTLATTVNTTVAFRCDQSGQSTSDSLACPGETSASRCSPGYEGYFCQSCMTGFHTTDRKCSPCAETSSTDAVWVIGAALLGVGLFWSYYYSKRNESTPGINMSESLVDQIDNPVANPSRVEDHPLDQYPEWSGKTSSAMHLQLRVAFRAAFQPIRMAVTWAQITTQIGGVLRVHYPPEFASAVEQMRFLSDLWNVFFDSECQGLSGIHSQWMMKVAVLPLMCTFMVVCAFVLIQRQNGTSVALQKSKSYLFGCVFLLYPTICNIAFATFECRSLVVGESTGVLEADDRLLCTGDEVVFLQGLSYIVIVAFALGVPVVFSVLLIRNAREYKSADVETNSALAKRLALEFEVAEKIADFILRDVTAMGADFAFLMDAYTFRHYYWESLDLIRKLMLVGLVLVVGRGSVAQNAVALLLSFCFFALQTSTQPYKLYQDNLFRCATEAHVFLVIVAAFIFRSDLSTEKVQGNFYDWALVISFIVLVPGAFIVTVVSKVWSARKTLSDDTSRGSFNRLRFGLGSDEDRIKIAAYVELLRTEVVTAGFANILEGRQWQPDNENSMAIEADDDDQIHIAALDAPSGTHAADAVLAPIPFIADAPTDDEYYGKFEQGHVGVFADMQTYFGGLEQLIGECRKDVLAAMKEEHCDVVSTGQPLFGESKTSFTTSNYGVATTPEQEWLFVVEPGLVGAMSAGRDMGTDRDRGNREARVAADLLSNAAELLSASFAFEQAGVKVTQEQVEALPLLLEEVIALRLYTGPMFEIYNTILRAWGNVANPGFVSSTSRVYPGLNIRDCFTTTIHVISSGILKISRLQPALPVFRGVSTMKLPRCFLEKDANNVRGGVEFGFMSTTIEEGVALSYAMGRSAKTSSTLIESTMGMVDRGASLDWLSQYPHEREILFPPLTAVEVISIDDQVSTTDGSTEVRRVTVRLSCNLISATIEKLLGVRKQQAQEMLTIVTKDLVKADAAADMRGRGRKLDRLSALIAAEEADYFVDNTHLTRRFGEIIGLLPKLGDEIQVMQAHANTICGLAKLNHDGAFASSSWDGASLKWQLDDSHSYRNISAIETRDGSLSVLSLGSSDDGKLINGLVNGSISIREDTGTEVVLPTGGTDPIVSIAIQNGQHRHASRMCACGDMAGKVAMFNLDLLSLVSTADVVAGDQPQHARAVSSLLWINDAATGQSLLATGSFDCKVTMWIVSADGSLNRQQEMRDVSCTAGTSHRGAVTSLAATTHHGQSGLASGSEDGSIKLWGLAGQLLRTVGRISLTGVNAGVCSLEWMPYPLGPDGPPGWLACGNGNGRIAIIDADGNESDELVHRMSHSGAVHALLWLEERGWLVSGSADKTVRTWRIRSQPSATTGTGPAVVGQVTGI